ncbi:hypothetical protein F0562_025832 [Nyssa sinensis]|uniref:PB1 domain-containing protein n=1 Tax=Nyssa sinensis TaxID=561372 RepID=A0A5J5B9L6_9ASTE|nr:hypothetical protein F0562_025832 [Nyssa sinensis]
MYSSQSAFSKWKNRPDHPLHVPVEATSQWLLKYVLFSVPFLHIKYRDESLPSQSAFSKWKNRPDDLLHVPVEATSQWLLKYVLFGVPFLHIKYRNESLPSQSAFSKWKNRPDDLLHVPVEATSQWLLKYVLFGVPLLHINYRDENLPKSRDASDSVSRLRKGTPQDIYNSNSDDEGPLGVELFVEVINNGRDIGSTVLSDAASRYSGGKGTINVSKRTHKITRQIYSREKGTMKTSKRKLEITKRKLQITREVLEQNFGRNFDDVAKSFSVNQSTSGPHLKIDEVYYSLSNMEPACSNMPRGRAMATAAHMMPHVTTMQDLKTVDIKAAYKGTLIRFKLPPTAVMAKLEEEIVKRLTFLQVGCFKVTYLDEDNDSILLACDSDLQNYIKTSIASGITKIRMFIELETNPQP